MSLSVAACGSVESCLKSATAMRMRSAPLEVSVLNQSCACALRVQRSRRQIAASPSSGRRAVDVVDVRARLNILSYGRCKAAVNGWHGNIVGGNQTNTPVQKEDWASLRMVVEGVFDGEMIALRER